MTDKISNKKKISRRKFLGTSTTVAAGGIVAGLAVGGVIGYFGGQATPAAPTTVTQTKTATVTEIMTAQPKRFKAALSVLGTVVNDGEWGSVHWAGLERMRDNLGFEIAFDEMLPYPGMEPSIRDYAAQGYDLVIGSGEEYVDPVHKVALDYPDTKFLITSCWVPKEPNVACIDITQEEGEFLAGAFAALVSKNNKVLYLGGEDYPVYVYASKAYIAGAKYAVPDVEADITWTGTWSDPAKGQEVAMAYIEKGFDMIRTNSGYSNRGAFTAAKESDNEVYIIGNAMDQNVLAPDVIITTLLTKYANAEFKVAQDLVAGKFTPKTYRYHIPEGTDLAPYHGLADKVPKEVDTKVRQLRQDIIDGKVEIPLAPR